MAKIPSVNEAMADFPQPDPARRDWRPFGWIIAASALAHLWCVGSVFFMDDGVAIQHSSTIQSGRFWEGGLSAWTYLGYVIQERLFGISAPAFHAVNWLLHTATACSLLLVGRRMFGDRRKEPVACFGAVLFAVHPLGSEIPNYARTQDLAWVTLFSLLACWSLLRFLGGGGWKNLLACLLFVFGATFSKGPGIFHALMMTGTLALAFSQPGHWLVLRKRWIPLAGTAVLGLALLWFSGAIDRFLGGTQMWSNPRFIGHGYTICRVFWEFAWRSVVPASLSADHHISETMMPASGDFQDSGAVWAAFGLLAITIFSVMLAWRKTTRVVGVCLFLFVGSIGFRLLYLIPEFMPEYRIYPGLPWFCLGAALVLNGALRKFTTLPPRIPAVVLTAVFIFLSAKRSFVWHDLDRLLEDVLAQYPTQARSVWEWHERDAREGNWQAILDRHRTLWPEVARRFHAENARLHPRGRELPTGHFALAEVACAGLYARALAKVEGPVAGLREIQRLEIYMRRLGLDPKAHAIHWGYFHYNKALVIESTGNLKAAAEILRMGGLPRRAAIDLERIGKKIAAEGK